MYQGKPQKYGTQFVPDGKRWRLWDVDPTTTDAERVANQKAWAGLRPKTPHGWPILGPSPQWENETLATGHNSIRIILSAITGQTIAECVTRRYIPDIIRPFSITRFEHEQKKSQTRSAL
jgi:glycine oxidase